MNKKQISTIALALGLIFLVIGLSTDNTIYSWISIGFILASLILGGRWMRPPRRK
ncbi:MAG: hypothetical protein IT311_13700 [Anaerolineales bacterium]|nr:hypothetical protein [Anaerolineales bacterium]MCZ2122162.1 hypothetical protein [Anaerolineales bacterium]